MAESMPRLLALSDTTRAPPELLLKRFEALAHAAQPGNVVLLLRDYALPLRARLELGQALAAIAERAQQRLGVADRADLARALGASWFHLPEAGLGASDARAYLGPSVRLSRACHAPNEPAEPELHARLLSPILEARKGRPALGTAVLGPRTYALGGVSAGSAAECLAAGAAGVAVIGAALEADPAPLLRALGILRG